MKVLRFILSVGLVLLFVWGVYTIMSRQGEAISTSSAQSEQQQKAEETPPPAPLYDTAALQQTITSISANYPQLDSAVSVMAAGEDITTSVQGDIEYIAASTTKVIVATYALSQVEAGEIALDDYISGLTLSEHITRMIGNSDNTSWYALLEYFEYKNITAYANANGAPSFDAVANTITPDDMSRFMNNMHTGKLINQTHTTYLEDIMAKSYTGPIKLATEHANIIRKAGWLSDRTHLTGIITTNGKTVSYAIYVKAASGSSFSYTTGSAYINEVLSAITAALQ